MKRFLIVAFSVIALIAIAVVYCLYRGINDGVQITILDAADGPLPHHTTVTCRYQFFDGVHTRPTHPAPPIAPNIPSVGECPWFAD